MKPRRAHVVSALRIRVGVLSGDRRTNLGGGVIVARRRGVPLIRLDSTGRHIYGCECWWAPL